ncbi:hypothetical protein D0817_10685 [Flavobacterium cupreum]|uniref:Uncharacterized protein n=2 Tax=Flavobacterium cupreum TaxID=2133766 RepID=A0A434A7F8_9FLAO|nr:hypothetical protein D0817_10685 [Flavobacterium cupreum]
MMLFSCVKTKESINNEDLNLFLSQSISKYYATKDQKHLLLAYNKLQYNKDFVENGLVGKNSLPIISLLLSLKKYDELEKLLVNNITINKYNRLNTLNTVRFLKFKSSDRPKAESYIKQSIEMIKDTVNKVPKDSLLYADYFSMRMFLVGKENTLKEIDSMKAVNKNYSEMFYESILKDNIENYPGEQ